MPSKAREALERNCADVERLLEIHTQIAPSGPGRKHNVDVLNRSAILMTCAFWEAYVEDACTEAVEHVVASAASHVTLPLGLRKQIAAQLINDKHELAVWRLADGGWRAVIQANLSALAKDRSFSFMSPKSNPINKLFDEALGLANITDNWKRRTLDSVACCNRLDDYVVLRGAIAHRGRTEAKRVWKKDCEDFLTHIRALAKCVDDSLSTFCGQVGAPGLF